MKPKDISWGEPTLGDPCTQVTRALQGLRSLEESGSGQRQGGHRVDIIDHWSIYLSQIEQQSSTYVVSTIKVFHHNNKIKQSDSLLKICAF